MGSRNSKPLPGKQNDQHTSHVIEQQPALIETTDDAIRRPDGPAIPNFHRIDPPADVRTSQSELPRLQSQKENHSHGRDDLALDTARRMFEIDGQTRSRNRFPWDRVDSQAINTETKMKPLSYRPDEPRKACKFFRQGICRYGAGCRYLHDASGQPGNQIRSMPSLHDQIPGLHNMAPSALTRRTDQESSISLSSGSASLTQDSSMSNTVLDTPGSPSTSKRHQPENVRHKKGKSLSNSKSHKVDNRLNGDRRSTVNNPEVQTTQQARSAKIDDKAETVDEVVLSSSKVTFGAGAVVLRVLTGFETCRIIIKNLPPNVTKEEIVSFLTQHGIDQNKFTLVVLYKTPDGSHQEAIVNFDDVLDGNNVVIALNDVEFGDEKVKFETTTNLGQMKASNREPNVLVVTWPAPSTSVVATYSDMSMQEVQEKARRLNNGLCCGRRVRVTMNKKPDKLPSAYFNPASVLVQKLSVDCTIESIQEFCGTSAIKYLKPRSYNLDTSMNDLQACIQVVGGDDAIVGFESQPTPAENGMISVKVRCASWEQAKKVHTYLHDKPIPFFAGSKCYALLADHFHFSTLIPFQQYTAQKSSLRSIAESNPKETPSGARVRLPREFGRFARVEVAGTDMKAVGSLKVRIEQLLKGERLEYWDQFFLSKEGDMFLTSVFDATNVFIRCDKRSSVLKAFGDPEAVKKSKSMIKEQVEKLASLEFTRYLKRTSIGFFLRRGMAVLKEQLGENNVTLEISSSPCKVTVRGGEPARHALLKLIDESLASTSTIKPSGSNGEDIKCPICFDDVDNPFSLACGHTYCNGCLRHFLITACDTKLFPLSCMGNEGTCKELVSIPTMQRFLVSTKFKQLLETSFHDYLDRHPDQFMYCPTPDCPQIYNLEEGKGSIRCPSCFASVCLSCRGENHEGFSCEEWKLHRDQEVQERLLMEWAAQHSGNVKKCPKCATFIEKNGGCNHMLCTQCQSHICWVCMQIVDRIYEHLNDQHGGAFDVPD